MKLLLTSEGITNNSIAKALFDLVGKPSEDTSVVFIPTASNITAGRKGWVVDDLVNLKKLNFKSVEITDISAVEEHVWKPILERADVLYFEGGDNYYLMSWLNKSGLSKMLPTLLKDKVYVGASAGSMVAGPDLALKFLQEIYGENLDETEDMKGLCLVDFYFLPHLNSEWFKKVRKENIEKLAQDVSSTIYVLDDNSALKVINSNVEVVGEGEWFILSE